MKINQFAQITVPQETMVHELLAIKFIDANFFKRPLQDNLIHFFNQVFPDCYTATTKKAACANLLATSVFTVTDLLDQAKPFNNQIFYNIALQLLGFHPKTDFKLNSPLEFMRQTKLAFNEPAVFDNQALLKNSYLLLTTHTRFGVTFLDDLANRGYFKDFQSKENPHPLTFNGKMQPVFDPNQVVKEVVYVESSLDTDQDGHRDLLETTIFRPRETNQGLKMPVLYTANPYYKGMNDVTDYLHSVDQEISPKTPSNTDYAAINYSEPTTQLPEEMPVNSESQTAERYGDEPSFYSLNDYFLPRGFVNVYAGGIGTRGSDGIRTCGSPAETESTIAIIQWLHGDRKAFTNRTDGIVIKAWWCNGNVAMTGKSYLGTLATAAATTGVAGLKTVISEAAISSWYDYYRDNGLVVAPIDCQGEDADVLAELCFSRQMDAGDYTQVKTIFQQNLAALAKDQDRVTGNYNHFWDERNYRRNLSNVKADMVMVHGLNDWNVKPRNVEKLWAGLRGQNISRKLFLHQGKHIYMNNMPSIDFTDMMNLWLSYELYGVVNHAKEILPNVTIQDNLTPETWTPQHDWSRIDQKLTLYHLTTKDLTTTKPTSAASLSFKDDGLEQFKQTNGDEHQWQQQLLTADGPYQNNRICLKTAPFKQTQIIDGKPTVTLQAAVDQPTGLLSVMLVDYGVAKRLTEVPTVLERSGYKLGYNWKSDDLVEFTTQAQTTPFKLITKGHINLQNRQQPFKNEEVIPNEFYTVHFELQPTRFHLAAGHQLGLVVYATDMGMTLRSPKKANYILDLNASQLEIPFRK
ncbi:Xaa-Pro dipeptidyl-peptidase [Loigolactobacillus backii]|uniref:Xaa-Pro dipeptidyl-peptidase n=1 Tax=Loigolactobacillus backii TaxID=375175 RepID=A0A192H3X6_9LACO|nr:Xaa-Pro dipeptidyl-peptidase [Loigolactobacillus backii]ANK59346.1 X-Pro dipeptidyl-peptidase [Loigolactobacillus backii]ANK63075.1 X-Pro dipeptidyl-peptidase [Loigolactobacillus backii]ANK64339.1 X-Pro dipeptidyl-peptidase [Loigolactobacillus backii]ANK67265.1 X-Pro dipeptidyl-peptidase [Loigolactobacillus backii]ANK69917.1 X-Pro dipeptidyl-peptidase [Loigolactobacillus backii]